ncbi:hypothetical protein MUTS15_14410 [Escherichia coli]|nr:hypothetical protein MUTS15_14410 [Escherichia coli]GHK46920.1 hypothetical protein ECZU08_25160 [Escherichia coli]
MDGNGDLPAQAVLLLGSGAAVKVAVGVDRAGKFIFGVSKIVGAPISTVLLLPKLVFACLLDWVDSSRITVRISPTR